MRFPPRISRRLRPFLDALEALTPVSSLIPGLDTIPISAVGFTGRDDRFPVPAQAHARSTASNQPVAVLPKKVLVSGSRVDDSASSSSATGSANSVSPESTFVSVISASATTSAEPHSPSAIPSPVFSGQAASFASANPPNSAILSRTSQPNTVAGSTATTGASQAPHVSPPIAITQAPNLNGIRPMTLPPKPTGSGHSGARTPSQSLHPFDMPGASGGAEPNLPPNLTLAGVAVYETSPGQYTAQVPIPIGDQLTFSLTSPYGNNPQGAITSYGWGGGTNFSSYFSASPLSGLPGQPALPASVQLGQNVLTNQSNYTFITDTIARQYSVTVSVGYQALGAGAATVTFTTVAPTGNLEVSQVGTQGGNFNQNTNTITIGLVTPIQIAATADSGPDTSGTYMFINVINSYYSRYVTLQGVSWYLANTVAFPGISGPLIDDGKGSLSYPYLYQGVLRYGRIMGPYQSMPDAISAPPQIEDSPEIAGPGNVSSLTSSVSYSTYLMYKPNLNGGVWIALSKAGWSWSETATQQGGVWNIPPSPQPNPGVMTPVGAFAFPTWVAAGSTLENTKFIQGQ